MYTVQENLRATAGGPVIVRWQAPRKAAKSATKQLPSWAGAATWFEVRTRFTTPLLVNIEAHMTCIFELIEEGPSKRPNW